MFVDVLYYLRLSFPYNKGSKAYLLQNKEVAEVALDGFEGRTSIERSQLRAQLRAQGDHVLLQ